jgi:hypothetical protein
MIEGRRAERQARERALVYRLGATNKVTKREKKKKISRGLRWLPISKKTHNNEPKTTAATEGTMEGRRAERQARERALVYCLGATNKVTKREKKKKYVVALGGRQSAKKHTTINQKQWP